MKKTYRVLWDDSYYTCTAVKVQNGFASVNYIGNGSLYSSDLPETAEPFCIYSVDILGTLLSAKIQTDVTGTSHTIGIEQIGKVNNRIPYSFLPRVYVMPTDLGFNEVRLDELEEAERVIHAGGKAYARYNNSTYQVIQAYRDAIDDQYHSLGIAGSSRYLMWSKERGWTGFSPYEFVIATADYRIENGAVESGKKFKFTVDETGTLTATDVSDS